MIRNLIRLFKNYFKLKADQRYYLICMCITSLSKNGVALIFPFFEAKVVEFIMSSDYKSVLICLISLATFYIIFNIISHTQNTFYAKNSNYTYNKLQQKVVDKVATFDDKYTKHISKAYLINTTASDIDKVYYMASDLVDTVSYLIRIIASIGILFFANNLIGVIVFAANILYFVLYNFLNERKVKHLARQRIEQDKIVALYEQVLDGSKEIKSFDMRDKLNSHLNKIKSKWKKEYQIKRNYHDVRQVWAPSFLYIAKLITYVILIGLFLKNSIEVSLIVLLIGYIDKIILCNEEISDLVNSLQMHSVSVDRLNNIFDYKPKTVLRFGNIGNDEIYGNVEFENISFEYENKTVIKNISFSVEKNAITAIVGKSGSGKSTLLKLLLRMYKPSIGNIYIDGVDIYNYSEDIYSAIVSIVTQKPFIFNMSIKENLDLVDTNTNAQIDACKRVGIHDFIMSLPQKYNTVLKEDAADISGGQKQLISIARTLLSKSEIILFDEVTSALDPNTTKHVVRVIKQLKKDHTIIMITHKPQLMKMADKLIVIDNGKLAGNGKHKKLLETNKYYKALQLK